MRFRLHRSSAATIARLAACALPLLLSCNRDLSVPQPGQVPSITKLVPHAAFADETVVIEGTGFDLKPENNEVRFQGGFVASPTKADATHLSVVVPQAVRDNGPLIVANRFAASAPSSDEFVPLGYGHPIVGNSVAELRFRHRPVGLIDSNAVVLVASTLFDALVDDWGAFHFVDGAPQALVRIPQGGGGLLSTRSAAGGHLIELDLDTSQAISSSAASDIVDGFILPLPATSVALARTIGVDSSGNTWLSTWTRNGAVLEAERVQLQASNVLGASIHGEEVVMIATVREAGVSTSVLTRVDPSGTLTTLWTGAGDAIPAGPLAQVDIPSGVAIVVALADGDLITLFPDATPLRRSVMLSFAPATAMISSLTPGFALLSKALDGAFFEFNVVSGAFDWVIPLRGSPTAIEEAPGLGEIVVANDADNSLDYLSATDGHWMGRSSISLGVGSVDGGDGGMVAPYSYDPDLPARPMVMQLLMRTAPLVVELDASALSVVRVLPLDATVSPPLRLAVTQDLQTLVIHQTELGLLTGAGEQIVLQHLPSAPGSIAFLRDSRVLLAFEDSVAIYSWQGGLLVAAGALPLPADATVLGLVSHLARVPGDPARSDGGADSLLLFWRTPTGLGGGFYDPATLADQSQPEHPLVLAAGLAQPTGVVDLIDGPAILFAKSSLAGPPANGPALVTSAGLRGEAAPLPGLTDEPLVTRASVDGRYLIWVNEGPGENVVRLIEYVEGVGLLPFAGYRLDGHGSGPGNDPSGEWLYVPVADMDTLSVVQ